MAYDFVYENYLRDIMQNGVEKGDRTGTGTKSVFGRQMRFDLKKGFPLITTKKVHMKSIVHELLWFLSGSSNIKYLTDNGVTIWNEWADENGELGPVYGVQWRSWPGKVSIHAQGKGNAKPIIDFAWKGEAGHVYQEGIDQIANAVKMLKTNPDGRRIIVSAWNPAEVDEMALPPCHALFQFWTRELSLEERCKIALLRAQEQYPGAFIDALRTEADLDSADIPTRALSCQLYQRSIH